MPVHYVNTPDGKRIEVTAPEGASQQEIVAYAQKMYAQEQKPQAPAETYNPTAGMSNYEKTMAGVGSAFVNTGMGLKQAGMWLGNKAGVVDDSTVADYQSQVDSERQLQAPLMDTGAGMAGNFGGNVALGLAGGTALAPLKAAQGASWLARGGVAAGNGAIGGGALAATQPVGSGETRLGNTVEGMKWGAAGGAAGHTIGTGVGRVAKGASDKYGDDVIELYNRAKAAGVNILPHQLSDSKMFKTVASVLSQLPFTGGQAANKAQLDEYNRMIAKIIGQDADAISPTVLKNAGAARDLAYANAFKGTSFPVGKDAYIKLLQERNAPAKYTEAERLMFDELIDQISANAPDGVMAGEIYNKLFQGWQGNGNQVSKAVRNIMEQTATKGLPAENVAMFKQARRMHGNLKTVERAMQGADTPRAATATEYKVNPATFRNAMGTKYPPSPEILMASRIGQKIKDPIPDSGTTGRSVALLGMGGAATGTAGLSLAALSPLAKMIAVGATAGRVANSKGLASYMTKGAPDVVKKGANFIEKTAPRALPMAAAGSAVMSAPIMTPEQFNQKLTSDMKSGRVTKKQAATQLDAYLQTVSRRNGIEAVRGIYSQFPEWSSVMNN